jgi:hypothetical protein
MLLVLVIFVLTLALYHDFGNIGTVRHVAKHAASFASMEDQDPSLAALEPANATLGVGKQHVPILIRTHADKMFTSLTQSLQFPANYHHAVMDFYSRLTSQDLTSRSRYNLSGPRMTYRSCVLTTSQL